MSASAPHSSSPASGFQHLTVLGLGLIGGSFLMAARQRFPNLHIQAVDTNPEALAFAERAHLVDTTFTVCPNYFEAEHLLVLGAHLPGNKALLKQLAPLVKDQAVTVMDLGSCKREISEQGQSLLGAQFIGGHPMAGRELSGIQQASPLLFVGKRFLLTPSPEAKASAAYPKLWAFLEALGCLPDELDPQSHDRAMAFMSHLPQLYSLALTNLLARHSPEDILGLYGGGIEGHLRLAASPHAMWGPIFQQNQDNVTLVLDELIDILQQLKTELGSETLARWFETSNQLHQTFHQLKSQQSHLK